MSLLSTLFKARASESSTRINQAITRCRSECDGQALLNLGCGNRINPKWVNADLGPMDQRVLRINVCKTLPFEDNQFDAVFHAHMLEHLEPEIGERVMHECVRIVRPGGVVRVSVPDFERFAIAYLENLTSALTNDPGASDKYDWSMLEMLDQLIRTRSGGRMRDAWLVDNHPAESYITERMGDEYTEARESFTARAKPARSFGPHSSDPSSRKLTKFRNSGEIHRWMYDRFSLPRLMETVGLVNPRVVAHNESGIKGWESYGLETRVDGKPMKPDTLAVEATKPE
ncbi:MAG: methyltransferase domain-containing protein [Phycisphaerales bacterium]